MGFRLPKEISSQPRYDHFDTSPYMLTRFRKINALFNFIRIFIRTQRVLKLPVCCKPALLKALWSFEFSKQRNISSAAPSTTRTTLHMSIRKSFPKLLERTDGKNNKIFGFSNCVIPQKHWILGGQNWHFFENFRVIRVMTASIPSRIYENCIIDYIKFKVLCQVKKYYYNI